MRYPLSNGGIIRRLTQFGPIKKCVIRYAEELKYIMSQEKEPDSFLDFLAEPKTYKRAASAKMAEFFETLAKSHDESQLSGDDKTEALRKFAKKVREWQDFRAIEGISM